jgi:hypothetical protein
MIVPDGAGGAIVTWEDYRAVSPDIYAHRVLASGALAPGWPADGRALCTAAFIQRNPTIAADGAGGAIVAWEDFRNNAHFDIYAQQVSGTGVVNLNWPADGRALCTANLNQERPVIVSDGAGGAIVAWQDARGGLYFDIVAQHVLASGFPASTWPTDGLFVCGAIFDQFDLEIVSDDAGGAILTWTDLRGASWDVYAHHLFGAGSVDIAWPVDGLALCTSTGDQANPVIVPDGAGGAIVTWQDQRAGLGWDVYAQHVRGTGVVGPTWPVNGRAISTAVGHQYFPTAIPDGAGGALITWYDHRSGPADIYAQRVARFGYLGTPEPEIASVRDVPNDNGGRVNVAWNASWLDTDLSQVVDHYWVLRSLTSTGPFARSGARSLAAAAGAHDEPGAVFTTTEDATTYYWELLAIVNALHIVSGYGYIASTTGDSTGTSNPPTHFMVVAWNAPGDLYWASTPAGGYSVDNLAPATPAPFSGEFSGGSAHLHWNPNLEPDLAGYRLYRGTASDFVPGPGNLIAAPTDTGYVDPAGTLYYYKLSAVDVHGNPSGFAVVLPSGTVGVEDGALPSALSLARPAPNPARTEAVLRWALPREARVSVAIYDASGRLVRRVEEGLLPAGEYVRPWDLRDDHGAPVASGLYFLRLASDLDVLKQRLAVLR